MELEGEVCEVSSLVPLFYGSHVSSKAIDFYTCVFMKYSLSLTPLQEPQHSEFMASCYVFCSLILIFLSQVYTCTNVSSLRYSGVHNSWLTRRKTCVERYCMAYFIICLSEKVTCMF